MVDSIDTIAVYSWHTRGVTKVYLMPESCEAALRRADDTWAGSKSNGEVELSGSTELAA